jgi:DNA-directed RNA polymerase subunit RPC12/RpoP
MAEWNWEKNNELGLDTNTLTCGSGKKVWWKCSEGHEWKALIKSRVEGNGCPYCSGRIAIYTKNDLLTLNPQLAIEWNYEKNADLKPEHFMPNSHAKVWWKCLNGHEWQATIDSRNRGNGCPYCSGRRVVKGENDLSTVNPNLAKEWNYERNGNLTPSNVLPTSNKKVWWICERGHEWQALISNRTKGSRCPICHSEKNTSFPEFIIIFYLKKHIFDVVHSYKNLGYELDVYIPSKNIAIEYDGYFYHKNKIKKDLDKNLKCKNDNIKLYRIREGLPVLNDSSIDYVIDKNQNNLEEVLQKVLSEITKINIDVDLKRDAIEIENLREHIEKTNSLLFSNPTLAKEWNYEKNGSLRPEHLLANSHKKVWWKCSKGHEWQSIIYSRICGAGCPYCSGQKVLKGYNDLTTINPRLASEWNYYKNGDLKPEDFTANSGKKVWWKCEKGHEWEATISNRNRGTGCPYCSGRKKG